MLLNQIQNTTSFLYIQRSRWTIKKVSQLLRNTAFKGKVQTVVVDDVVRRVTSRDIVKFPVNIPAANVEIVGTWKSVVVRNRINKAREEMIADVEGNLEENETVYG